MPHDFDKSKGVEDRWAPVLDEWLRQHYRIREATRDEQWRGIDRVAIDDDGREVGIDYKCDQVAQRTGNLFVETVSNDRSGRKGWTLTGEAEWVFYFATPSTVYAFREDRLREALPGWTARFKTRPAPNARFNTLGVCVPVAAAEQVAEYVARLDRDDGPVLQARDADEAA
jgi:hypothetical protein